jgi:hypothetical protein
MMRAIAALAAAALYGLVALPSPVGVTVGLAGLLPAAVAILARWPLMAVVAACGYLVAYTVALSIGQAALRVAPALTFGLALVVFLEAADLSARVHRATVQGGVVRAALGRWLALGFGVLAVTIVTLTTAGPLARILPQAVSPLVAAAGGLASVLIVAALVRRAA